MQVKAGARSQHQFRARRASLPAFRFLLASKGGVKMLTRNLSIELALSAITINNIRAGAIETPINTKLLNDPVS